MAQLEKICCSRLAKIKICGKNVCDLQNGEARYFNRCGVNAGRVRNKITGNKMECYIVTYNEQKYNGVLISP